MYKCDKCGETFIEPGTYEEDRGEFWGGPCSEKLPCCPYCGYDEFDEVDDDMEDTKYKCLDCNKTFDCPDWCDEDGGSFWGASGSIPVAYCPECGSNRVVEEEKEVNNDESR